MRAWQARAPVLSAEQRLASARIAAGLGVFSSQALIDLYAEVYDQTDPSDLAKSDAWQVRLAVTGKKLDDKIGGDPQIAGRRQGTDRDRGDPSIAGAGRRSGSRPTADLQEIAPELISAMLAGGFDREAARWARVIDDMDDEFADRCWAMLALGAPTTRGIDLRGSRVGDFIDRDNSAGKQRSALLVAGLAGLGRISTSAAGQFSQRYGLGLGGRSEWTG